MDRMSLVFLGANASITYVSLCKLWHGVALIHGPIFLCRKDVGVARYVTGISFWVTTGDYDGSCGVPL